MKMTHLSMIAVLILAGCPQSEPENNSGKPNPPANNSPANQPKENTAGEQPDDEQPAAKQNEQPKEKKPLVKQRTREIFDKTRLMADEPDWKEIELAVSASDPISAATSSFAKAATFASAIPLQQWLKTEKIVNGKAPTYEQLQTFMEKNPRVELQALPEHRRYAYDQQRAAIVVMEKK